MKIPQPKILLPFLLLPLFLQAADAGPLRDRLEQRRMQRQEQQGQRDDLDADMPRTAVTLPAGVEVVRDVAYGNDPRQRFDVYRPVRQGSAPAAVIFMVHGGGWRHGDKEMGRVVENKVARWVPQGFLFISINYRLLPQASVQQQADDVALALATAQRMAGSWGGDAERFVLMGHSAGAHLVALLSADPARAVRAGARAWRGSVLLDSAALDVVQIMQGRHMRLYDPAFGTDPAYWRAMSPMQQLTRAAAPMLAVCSTRRSDSCPQAAAFAARAQTLGVRVERIGEDLSHRQINEELGADNAYTVAVERFLDTLDPAFRRLGGGS